MSKWKKIKHTVNMSQFEALKALYCDTHALDIKNVNSINHNAVMKEKSHSQSKSDNGKMNDLQKD